MRRYGFLAALAPALLFAPALACASLYAASEEPAEAGTADAGPDAQLDPGDDRDAARTDAAPPPVGSRYAFVTSLPVNGALGTSADADKVCNDAAAAVPALSGRVFVAFVAFGTPPKLPVLAGDGGPWVMRGGQPVTDTPPTASTIPKSALVQNEIGNAVLGYARVWTGIGPDNANCLSWTSSGGDVGSVGNPFVAAEWLRDSMNPRRACYQPSRLYCFEK